MIATEEKAEQEEKARQNAEQQARSTDLDLVTKQQENQKLLEKLDQARKSC